MGLRDPQRRWARFRMGARLNMALEGTAAAAFSKVQQKVAAQALLEGRAVSEIGANVELSYHQQGNAEMYTAENLHKRKALQRDPRLLACIERWWDTCISSTSASGGEWAGELPKAEFIALNCRLYKALMPEYDEAEAVSSAEEDWRTDVGVGQDTMSKTAFVSSLLELVDVWTHTAEADEYCAFLNTLFNVIARIETEQATVAALRGSQQGGRGEAWTPWHAAELAEEMLGGESGAAAGGAGGLRHYLWRAIADITSQPPALARWMEPEEEEASPPPQRGERPKSQQKKGERSSAGKEGLPSLPPRAAMVSRPSSRAAKPGTPAAAAASGRQSRDTSRSGGRAAAAPSSSKAGKTPNSSKSRGGGADAQRGAASSSPSSPPPGGGAAKRNPSCAGGLGQLLPGRPVDTEAVEAMTCAACEGSTMALDPHRPASPQKLFKAAALAAGALAAWQRTPIAPWKADAEAEAEAAAATGSADDVADDDDDDDDDDNEAPAPLPSDGRQWTGGQKPLTVREVTGGAEVWANVESPSPPSLPSPPLPSLPRAPQAAPEVYAHVQTLHVPTPMETWAETRNSKITHGGGYPGGGMGRKGNTLTQAQAQLRAGRRQQADAQAAAASRLPVGEGPQIPGGVLHLGSSAPMVARASSPPQRPQGTPRMAQPDGTSPPKAAAPRQRRELMPRTGTPASGGGGSAAGGAGAGGAGAGGSGAGGGCGRMSCSMSSPQLGTLPLAPAPAALRGSSRRGGLGARVVSSQSQRGGGGGGAATAEDAPPPPLNSRAATAAALAAQRAHAAATAAMSGERDAAHLAHMSPAALITEHTVRKQQRQLISLHRPKTPLPDDLLASWIQAGPRKKVSGGVGGAPARASRPVAPAPAAATRQGSEEQEQEQQEPSWLPGGGGGASAWLERLEGGYVLLDAELGQLRGCCAAVAAAAE